MPGLGLPRTRAKELVQTLITSNTLAGRCLSRPRAGKRGPDLGFIQALPSRGLALSVQEQDGAEGAEQEYQPPGAGPPAGQSVGGAPWLGLAWDPQPGMWGGEGRNTKGPPAALCWAEGDAAGWEQGWRRVQEEGFHGHIKAKPER